ncbi:hypothetical protein [Streptomyces sp. NPDC006551]
MTTPAPTGLRPVERGMIAVLCVAAAAAVAFLCVAFLMAVVLVSTS